jgi:hypothetical protein
MNERRNKRRKKVEATAVAAKRHNDGNKNNFHMKTYAYKIYEIKNKKNTCAESKHVCLNGIIKMIRLIHFIC